ncbi:hypothetical protein XENOCAPTIV_003341, partial [Xenoophorus captivus]
LLSNEPQSPLMITCCTYSAPQLCSHTLCCATGFLRGTPAPLADSTAAGLPVALGHRIKAMNGGAERASVGFVSFAAAWGHNAPAVNPQYVLVGYITGLWEGLRAAARMGCISSKAPVVAVDGSLRVDWSASSSISDVRLLGSTQTCMARRLILGAPLGALDFSEVP